MKNFYSILLLNCLMSFSQSQQKDSIPALNFNVFNTKYKDFQIVDYKVFALTEKDSLVAFELNSNQGKFLEKNVMAISKNSKNRLIIAKKDGNILELGPKQTQEKIDISEGIIMKILLDKNDKVVVISDKYIYYQGKKYRPDRKSVMFGLFGKGKTFVPIDVCFLDSKQRLWFGYDNGEWGGNICFFDLISKKFYNAKTLSSLYKNDNVSDDYPKLHSDFPDKIKHVENDTLVAFPYEFAISNIKGIAEDKKGNIYTSESLMHMALSESIRKFTNFGNDFYKCSDLTDVLDHDISVKNFNGKTLVFKDVKEYLGTITYNAFDDAIYYYTDQGFFKIIENNSKFTKEFIFKPWIIWEFGMRHSVGYQMNIEKFEFLSEKELIFLTSGNGIGFFNGKTVKYYQ